jgi:hypothetical protein
MHMTFSTRKVVIPVVLGVWTVVLLVGAHTVATLPWFTDYYDFYGAQPGFGHAKIAIAFRHGYPFGALLGLMAVIAGIWLLYRGERSTPRLIWFAAASLVLAVAWFVCALLAERSIYVLSLPA